MTIQCCLWDFLLSSDFFNLPYEQFPLAYSSFEAIDMPTPSPKSRQSPSTATLSLLTLQAKALQLAQL
jgi:hypothetical protein